MRGQFLWPFAGLRLGALPAMHYRVAEMDGCTLEIEGETGCGEGSNGRDGDYGLTRSLQDQTSDRRRPQANEGCPV